ncbi:MAG: class I SAM-dependent methyltransferase, partial [Symploca sp. SIO1A3]|nr:class I SAM-dependent methyltransferase [Symploca sp. SIO1A3]
MHETNPEAIPLHQMNPLSRFSEQAGDYRKYRPSYPDAAIATILEGLGKPSSIVAADVGAGTGISSRLLAHRGVRVLAIEPNAAMRQEAQPHPLIEFSGGTAEATNLETASTDLVTCFQAFHWFNPKPALQEFHRILKPGARLAVVWNNRDRQDEFTCGYSDLVRRVSNNHPAESRLVAVEPLLVSPLFPQVVHHSFSYQQQLDLEGLIGRANSVSYISREPKAQQQLICGLQELCDRYCDENGFVYMVYMTSVYLAESQTARY